MKPEHNIVHGGGWKNPKRNPVKIRALCSLLLGGATTIAYFVEFAERAAWSFVVPVIFFLLAAVLLRKEKPVLFPGWPDGEDDPRKLYLGRGK